MQLISEGLHVQLGAIECVWWGVAIMRHGMVTLMLCNHRSVGSKPTSQSLIKTYEKSTNWVD